MLHRKDGVSIDIKAERQLRHDASGCAPGDLYPVSIDIKAERQLRQLDLAVDRSQCFLVSIDIKAERQLRQRAVRLVTDVFSSGITRHQGLKAIETWRT